MAEAAGQRAADLAGYAQGAAVGPVAVKPAATLACPIVSVLDRWLADSTLFGPPAKIRDGVAAWREAGIRTPVLVPLSPDGDQRTALRQVFAAFE